MQRVAQELLEALKARDDISVDAILLRTSWKWIHFRILPFLAASFIRLRTRIEDGKVDTILFSSMVSALLVIPLGRHLKMHGVKTAVIVHGLDITTPVALYQGLVRYLFQRIDLVLPVSHATAKECVSRGLPESRIRIIHNGVSRHRFNESPPRQPARGVLSKQFSIDSGVALDDIFLLCSVGRHVLRKGYAWFIESVMPLLPDDIHYFVAGVGPEYENILSSIRKSGLAKRVRLLGRLSESELEILYRGSDLFIMPNIKVENDMEGFGIVMLEAGMNALPSIASRIEGIAEVIQEGSNGHFVRSGDAEGFAEIICAYADGTRDLENARISTFEYTSRTFGWETIAERVVESLSAL